MQKQTSGNFDFYLAHWPIPPRAAEFTHVCAYKKFNRDTGEEIYVYFDGSEHNKSCARLKRTKVDFEKAENHRLTFRLED